MQDYDNKNTGYLYFHILILTATHITIWCVRLVEIIKISILMNRRFGENSGRNIRFTLTLMDRGICKLHWSGVKHCLLNNV